MNDQNDDTRLTPQALETAVDFAYGGAAVREGRKAQARAFADFFRGKSAVACKPNRSSRAKA